MDIILEQKQYDKLIEANISMLPDKTSLIVNYINKHFIVDRNPSSMSFGKVFQTDSTGKVMQEVDSIEMFYILQTEFKTIANRPTRDAMLKAVLKDWYRHPGFSGLLSGNF